MSIADVFNKYANEYDVDRRKLIPCYDDFYGVAAAVPPFQQDRELRILDVGAGTGLFSAIIAARYPRARLTLVDISADMLALAEKRFADRDMGRTVFLLLDYARQELRGTYDLIISSLSIHHLEDADKRTLFAQLAAILEPGGMFLNADQIRGENELSEKIYRRNWLARVKEAGISPEAMEASFERMKTDRCSPLSSQLSWLKEAGFSEVTTWYQYYCFAVYSGTIAATDNTSI